VAHSVIWSERALQDVEALGEYIERDSAAYARAVDASSWSTAIV
jgi:plasmid stabilization system protein ParE